MNKLAEELLVVEAIYPRDIGTVDATGPFISMDGCNRVLVVLTTAWLTGGKFATIELLQATSSEGANAKALKAAVTGTAPIGGGRVIVQVEVSGDEFDTNNGFIYFAAKATCNEDAKFGAAVAIKGGLRYSN